MQVHNLKETMTKKGVEFARECLIFEVCQHQQATLKPTTLLAMFNAPHLEGVAQEVEATIVKIMKEAASG